MVAITKKADFALNDLASVSSALTDCALSPDGQVAYVGGNTVSSGGNDGAVEIWDISDLSSPAFVSALAFGADQQVRALLVGGGHLFVNTQDRNTGGNRTWRSYSLANPAIPSLVQANNFGTSIVAVTGQALYDAGYLYGASSLGNGSTVDATNPAAMTIADGAWGAGVLGVQYPNILVGDGPVGRIYGLRSTKWQTCDVSNPAALAVLGDMEDFPLGPGGVAVNEAGTIGYRGDTSNNAIRVYDLDPEATSPYPVLATTPSGSGGGQRSFFRHDDDHLVVLGASAYVFDTSDPLNIAALDSLGGLNGDWAADYQRSTGRWVTADFGLPNGQASVGLITIGGWEVGSIVF